MEEILKSSQEWCDQFKIEVYDPDGWDRRNFKKSWTEKITKKEFINRVIKSTINMSTIERLF